jgi:hypothetical protein
MYYVCMFLFPPLFNFFRVPSYVMEGPGSVDGIATGYGLGGPGIESRWGRDFSAPVHTGPGTHPASCTMGTGSVPGVKSGRGVTLTPHPVYCRGHERVELYLYSPYRPNSLYRASVPVQRCTLPLLYVVIRTPGASVPQVGNHCFRWMENPNSDS